MKKTIFLLAAFCLLLAGCGAGDTGDTPNETPAASVQTPAPSQGEAPDNTATAPPAGSGETTANDFDLERGVVTLNNGIEMPILGIGTFRLSNEQAENSVYWALRDGYRLIDTARIYGNEQGVGRGIQRAIDEGLVTREEIFVTTKMWTDDYDNGAEAIDRSLERLGLDYIDLMILHHSQLFKIISMQMLDVGLTETGIDNILRSKLFGEDSYWYSFDDPQFVKQILNQFKAAGLLHSSWNKSKSTLFWSLTKKGVLTRDQMMLIKKS